MLMEGVTFSDLVASRRPYGRSFGLPELPRLSNNPSYAELKMQIEFLVHVTDDILGLRTLCEYTGGPVSIQFLNKCEVWGPGLDRIIACYLLAICTKFRLDSRLRERCIVRCKYMYKLPLYKNCARKCLIMLHKQKKEPPDSEKFRQTLVVAGLCDDLAVCISSFIPHSFDKLCASSKPNEYHCLDKYSLWTMKNGKKKYFKL